MRQGLVLVFFSHRRKHLLWEAFFSFSDKSVHNRQKRGVDSSTFQPNASTDCEIRWMLSRTKQAEAEPKSARV